MILALLGVFQTTGPGTVDASPLSTFSTVPRCPSAPQDDDVVVCGRTDQARYRLHPTPPRYRSDGGPGPKAGIPLAGGTLSATAEQGNVGGVSAPRATLSWKLKF